jgi:superfamily II DNA or RNA helicase
MRPEYDFSKGERGKFFHADAKLILPATVGAQGWAGPEGDLGAYLEEESRRTIDAYAAQRNLVLEHAHIEQDTAHGGYAHRQLFELIQNGADALSGASEGGRIAIRLTDACLYCADDGEPIDRDGVKALMFSHMSPKRGTSEIGRFGLSFKSVLGVTDAPEFFSRAGSFRFDRQRARERIREVAPDAERCPVLRVADPVDPHEARDQDAALRDLMDWATNVVRLRLKPGATDDLRRQLRDFPSEFLLFVQHVRQLRIEDGSALERVLELEGAGEDYRLVEGSKPVTWKRFKVIHRLSTDARADRRSLDDGNEVAIWWAAPVNRLSDPGRFWAYFPTQTTSLVAGILNAPWKTNEDRQNLLPGPYNEELIEGAAALVADKLPELATGADPARHLDALPRRREAGDSEQSERLRRHLLDRLCDGAVVPDQNGVLRRVQELKYPPPKATRETSTRVPEPERDSGAVGRSKHESLQRWAQYAGRPSNWLHHDATTRNHPNRLARVRELIDAWNDRPPSDSRYVPALQSASLAEWLEALVSGKSGDDAIEASRAAIATAAALPREYRHPSVLGCIVLMQNGRWHAPDPERVFLPSTTEDAEPTSDAHQLVCANLALDEDTRRDLCDLGLKPVSAEDRFAQLAARLLGLDGDPTRVGDSDWYRFWELAREVGNTIARETITGQQRLCRLARRQSIAGDENSCALHVRTQSETWVASHRALLPGSIVPGAAGEDQHAALDLEFHEEDVELLKSLGVMAGPQADLDVSAEPWFDGFLQSCRHRFRARKLPANPQESHLHFRSTKGAGPLDVLTVLSDGPAADYTTALLDLDSAYQPWVMRHDSRPDHYRELEVASPAVQMLKEHGRIRVADSVVRFEDALGPQPRSKAARDKLLAHPKADRIKAAFDLVEPAESAPEFFGEEDPIPLSDVWPGFRTTLQELKVGFSNIDERAHLVHCDRILVGGDERQCILHASNIWVCRSEETRVELERVLQLVPMFAAGMEAADEGVRANAQTLLLWTADRILDYTPPPRTEEYRAAIRALPTDAERLLRAVGEPALRRQLPPSLLAILQQAAAPLSGAAVAAAAIATYHTGSLKQYRRAIEHLDPPRQWAGSARALDFVLSLGFSAEWAGQRKERRPPFVEVDGPYALPELHDYQKVIVAKVRDMLRPVRGGAWGTAARSNTDTVRRDGSSNGHDRRGMINLPTGSGKTRVAVQAIVEAMCHDGFDGGVLWVADRDELCEQAVEAWTQVWSNVGARRRCLRVSRMWAGQPAPLPTTDLHVVVATIQTLHARFQNPRGGNDLLADCTLVVFDEAHRSIAPTFTSVMEEIGLTRWQRKDEPFLIGLTATPYRGHDAEETDRLVKRYGRNRLDAGAFASDDPEQVVSELQRMQVLALADHQTIDGGRFSLNADECRQMNTKPRPPWLPRSVEDRIAQDAARTNRIIEAYEKQVRHVDPEWPVLIFATSVEHARTIAALLSRIGVPSRAVSGETETVTRRRIVEEFRRGDLKVLVNYGVFREGFDAPRTRVIIVARPVYSPNLYFQMIGRGLRGTRNGGTDRCLIINVQDNIDNFEGRLAFSDLDWLWA